VADYHFARHLDALAEDSELFASEFGLAENRLYGFSTKFVSVLLEHRSIVGNSFVDLADRSRWGHDLSHGVILSKDCAGFRF